MMPDATKPTPSAPDAPANWVSLSAAAALLGISERSAQRWAKSGKITARQVRDRRGVCWQVDAATLDGAATNGGTMAARGGTKQALTGAGENRVINDSAATGAANVPPLVVRLAAPSKSQVERLESEVEFLRETLRREQNAHDQTRQLLAGALTMHAHQLTAAPVARIEADDVQNDGARTDSLTTGNGPQNGAERAETGISLGDIADWLERENNK